MVPCGFCGQRLPVMLSFAEIHRCPSCGAMFVVALVRDEGGLAAIQEVAAHFKIELRFTYPFGHVGLSVVFGQEEVAEIA